jgi:sulfur-carrier protein
MPVVRFPRHLLSHVSVPQEYKVDGSTVNEIVQNLRNLHPMLCDYIVDEAGSLRKHVNIFVGEQLIRDRQRLSDRVGQDEEVYVMQALSGG